jgi:hypothetical protein
MVPVVRKQYLDVLKQDWGTYVKRYRLLSDNGRRRFLSAQGYSRFADLLAHFIAWWQEGMRKGNLMLEDPIFRPPEIDIDEFNARAVERFSGMNEPEVERTFEATRQEFAGWVRKLPEKAFEDKRITDWLHMDILGHLEEHQIPLSGS